MKKIFCIFVVVLAISGFHLSAFGQEYLIGEGDILAITVYDNDDLNTTVRVSGEGMISMPLLGQIKVGSMDVSSIGRHVEALLADGYLVSPQVNVFINEYRSKKVTILGQVTKPGLYELQGTVSLLELVSRAGGLTEDAGGLVTIKRKTVSMPGSEESITLDMERLIEQGDTSLNVQIHDGDAIYIAKAGIFFVTGEVEKPGSYKYEENPTILKAITLAGGLTDKAAPGKVRIIRKIEGQEVVLERVAMDAQVLEDDVIVIPESFF